MECRAEIERIVEDLGAIGDRGGVGLAAPRSRAADRRAWIVSNFHEYRRDLAGADRGAERLAAEQQAWCFAFEEPHVATSTLASRCRARGGCPGPRCLVLIVPGRAALSAARQVRALAKGRAVCPGLRGLSARWIHLVVTTRPLAAAEASQLDEMLAYGPADDGLAVNP